MRSTESKSVNLAKAVVRVTALVLAMAAGGACAHPRIYGEANNPGSTRWRCTPSESPSAPTVACREDPGIPDERWQQSGAQRNSFVFPACQPGRMIVDPPGEEGTILIECRQDTGSGSTVTAPTADAGPPTVGAQ